MTSFNPQIKASARQSGRNGCYVATAAEALAYAEDLQGRWNGCRPGPDNRRAEPSSNPVNYSWNFLTSHAVPVTP